MLPLAALGVAAGAAALVVLQQSGDSDADAGPAQDEIDNQEDDTMTSSAASGSVSARTLSWRDELAAQAPELDTDVLLRWIQRESDGDAGAVGSVVQLRRDGWAREAGIGQVYFESRTQRVFGVTSDELRVAAVPGGQGITRDLTEPERLAQTGSLIAMARQYVIDGGRMLGQLGVTWEAPDIYCLTKLKHALPILAGAFLLHAGADNAGSWDTFRAWLEALSLAESIDIYSGSTAYYPWARYLKNAQYVGRGE